MDEARAEALAGLRLIGSVRSQGWGNDRVDVQTSSFVTQH